MPFLLEKLISAAKPKKHETGYTAPGILPAQIDLSISSDLARFIEGRIDLLQRRRGGRACVCSASSCVVVANRLVGFVGLTLALCGTLTFMALTGTTLNLLTMFGLIIVIGLLADDAIVVRKILSRMAKPATIPETAAILGTKQVFWPVTATIATSIVAFAAFVHSRPNRRLDGGLARGGGVR